MPIVFPLLRAALCLWLFVARAIAWNRLANDLAYPRRIRLLGVRHVTIQGVDHPLAILSNETLFAGVHLLLSQILFRRGDEAGAKEERELSLKLRRQNPESVEAVQSRPFPER